MNFRRRAVQPFYVKATMYIPNTTNCIILTTNLSMVFVVCSGILILRSVFYCPQGFHKMSL